MHLQSRSNLSDDMLYTQFYSSTGIPKEALLQAWKRIASLLHCQSGQLRPQDTLRELAGIPQWLGNLNSDLDDIAYEIAIHIKDARLNEEIKTVDDVIFALCLPIN